MSRKRKDYEVGYAKPPKDTRFEKGQSGNRKGRPKGSRNFASDVDDILNAKMTVNENGRPRNVSTQLAALMRLREKALKGDARALDRLLSLADERSAEREAQNKERSLSTQEEDILQRFLEGSSNSLSEEDQNDGE